MLRALHIDRANEIHVIHLVPLASEILTHSLHSFALSLWVIILTSAIIDLIISGNTMQNVKLRVEWTCITPKTSLSEIGDCC